MAPAASTGRQRYRWLLLLAAATMLVAWLVAGGGEGGDDPAVDTSSTSSSASSSASSTPDDGTATDAASGLPVVRLAALPPEAGRTVELIDAGGPFPEPTRDGGTFGNREELLPDRPMGYYREYTVPTPGVEDRGARRIVAGDGEELYWTDDHYSSFSLIRR
jgi:ribonuclease T1